MHLNVYILKTNLEWESFEKVKAYSEEKPEPCHFKEIAHMQVGVYSRYTK